MSSILAVCPAPFQRHKHKKDKQKGAPSNDDVSLPAVKIIDQLMSSPMAVIAELEEPIVREHGCSEEPIPKSVEATTACQHHRHHPPPSHNHSYNRQQMYSTNNTHHNHHAHCPCENDSQPSSTGSNDSHSTHTSGYQTDDGSFEGKMLHRATRDRPANLRMTAIRDYRPCCHEELPVRKGQRVKVLYKNNDWVYAVAKSGEAGYIPYHFVRPSRKYAGYQSEPEFCHNGDAYQSGYDTDMPLPNSRRGRRAHQIGDIVPAYSVHTGFNGSPPNRYNNSGLSQPLNTQRAHLSGYTSALEYSGGLPTSRQYPRSARSMHSVLNASSSQLYRPVEPKPVTFSKDFLEELVVIHDFEASEEDEVFVGKGERVKVLNAEDPFWLWVETTPGDQGFIPRSCCSLGNHPSLQSSATRRANARMTDRSRHARRYYYERSRQQMVVARQARSQAKLRFQELAKLRSHPQNPVCMDKEEIKRVGSKLIVLMDYTATQDDELNLEFAETVIADVLKQAGAERVWAYCPRSDRCGYIPVSMVVPPVV